MKKIALPLSLLAAMTVSMAFGVNVEDPINKKCPITGKDIVAGRTSEYKKQLIGFCCGDCVSKFEGDPEKYIKKVKEFKKTSVQ
jgi:YHS domain-containing protein